MHPILLALLIVLGDPTIQAFDREGEGTPYTLTRYGAEPGPVTRNGQLAIIDGSRPRGPLQNTIGFPRTAPGCHREIRASFRFRIGRGAHGIGFALLDTGTHGEEGPGPSTDRWESPNIEGATAIGLNIHNPPTRHWFDSRGNVHDNPQREISLHHDGKEILRALSPVEFRDDRFHRLRIRLRHAAGGAHVSAIIDDTPVWKDRFVPGILPRESRVALGGRTGALTTSCAIDDLKVEFEDPAEADRISPSPIRIRTFNRDILNGGAQNARRTFALPDPSERFQRILLTLTLGPGTGGWDDWDRCAAVYAYAGEERYEIMRYITPYRREYTWVVDVTDYQSLLRGERDLGVHIGSWQAAGDPQSPKGFAVTVDLDFYPGMPDREPYRVVNLWNLWYTFGNDTDSIARAFPEKKVDVDAGATGGKLRIWVTGHGGFGEFTPSDREVLVQGNTYEDRLWKEDVYLNPCRPQSGTWKFERAGWAPGSVVDPWDIDVTDLIVPGKDASILYRPRPFDVPPGRPMEASHWVESQLILYRAPE